MDPEERKSFERLDFEFKIIREGQQQFLQSQINVPLAKIINEDKLKYFTIKNGGEFQTLVTTQGIATAFALTYK